MMVWPCIIRMGRSFLALFTLRFQWHESSGITVLVRQLHEHDDHGAWGQGKGAGSLEDVASDWVKVHLCPVRSRFNRRFRQSAIYADDIVGMVRDIDRQFPIPGQQFHMIRPGHP